MLFLKSTHIFVINKSVVYIKIHYWNVGTVQSLNRLCIVLVTTYATDSKIETATDCLKTEGTFVTMPNARHPLCFTYHCVISALELLNKFYIVTLH